MRRPFRLVSASYFNPNRSIHQLLSDILSSSPSKCFPNSRAVLMSDDRRLNQQYPNCALHAWPFFTTFVSFAKINLSHMGAEFYFFREGRWGGSRPESWGGGGAVGWKLAKYKGKKLIGGGKILIFPEWILHFVVGDCTQDTWTFIFSSKKAKISADHFSKNEENLTNCSEVRGCWVVHSSIDM